MRLGVSSRDRFTILCNSHMLRLQHLTYLLALAASRRRVEI